MRTAWLVALFLLPVITQAGTSCLDRDAAQLDDDFYLAITDQPARLRELLTEDFVYHTTADTRVGKDALIKLLLSGSTRVRAPAVVVIQRLCRKDSLVSEGEVTLEVVTATGSLPITADFFHVWVREEGVWRLLYRRSETGGERESRGNP